MKIDAQQTRGGLMFHLQKQFASDEKDADIEEQITKEVRQALAISVGKFLEPHLPIKLEKFVDREVRSTRLYVISHAQYIQIILKELDPLIEFCSNQVQRDEMRETFKRILQILDSDDLGSDVPENPLSDERDERSVKTSENERIEQETANLAEYIKQMLGLQIDEYHKEIFSALQRDGKISIFLTRGDLKKMM